MKRTTLFLCLMMSVLLLCSCGKANTDDEINAIDFADYTVDEVIAWANENDMASKFSYVYSADTEEPYGSVIAQSVESGSPIKDGIEITVSSKDLLLSAGSSRTIIPNVIGKSFSDAKSQLESLGLSVDSRYESSAKEKDTVLQSAPLPGVSVSENTKVMLTLSSGTPKEPSLSVRLEIKSTSSTDNVIKVYVDGELDGSKTVSLDPSVTTKVFKFSGRGIKDVKFTLNNEFYAHYQLDFENKEVKKID